MPAKPLASFLTGALLLIANIPTWAGLPPCSYTYGSPFLDAVGNGDLSQVQAQVEQAGAIEPTLGARALAVSIKPISTKCHRRDADHAMFALLVKLGADVNLVSERVRDQGTALMFAADSGDAGIIKLALRAGARANVEVQERSPLIVAIRARNASAVQLLLEHGADPNFAAGRFTALAEAARHPGHKNEVLKLLMKHGAKIPPPRDARYIRGIYPLEELVFYAGLPEDADETVTLLLKAGGKIDGEGRDPYSTPLAVAMDSAHTKLAIVEALLKNGANPNGGALYRLASRQNHGVDFTREELLHLLYRYGARAERAKMPGRRPLKEYVLVNNHSGVGQAYLRELEEISLEYQPLEPVRKDLESP